MVHPSRLKTFKHVCECCKEERIVGYIHHNKIARGDALDRCKPCAANNRPQNGGAPEGNSNAKGHVLSDASKALISKNTKLGMKWSGKKFGRPAGTFTIWNGGKWDAESIEKRRQKMKGRKLTQEHKNKIRKSAVNYLNDKRQIRWPCIGKYEKSALDNLEQCFNYPIERQYQVAGFYVDGYCPALNLVIEIDEKHHIKQVEEDKMRENLIKNELQCSFLRIPVGGDYAGN